MKIRGKGDRLFDFIVVLILLTVMIVIVYPMYFTIIASLSNPYAVSRGEVLWRVVGFTLEPYQNVVRNTQIWTGFYNTIVNTVLVTFYNLALTIPCAYVLSRKVLPIRNLLMTYFMITMYFSGGIIPSYLLVRDLRLLNTRWALILPVGFSVYNMIIARSFFQTSFSQELFDAASIDGASEFKVFTAIVLPLSGSIIAVISLYVIVSNWNSYFNALLYVDDKSLFPLQYVLRNILIAEEGMSVGDMSSLQVEEIDEILRRQLMVKGMKYSLVFIASAPMIAIYPFVQKHFVKGVMIGAVKG